MKEASYRRRKKLDYAGGESEISRRKEYRKRLRVKDCKEGTYTHVYLVRTKG